MKRLVTIAALALVLAACSSSEPAATTTTTTSDAGGGAGTTSTTAATAATTTTTLAGSGAGSESLATCIVGTWELDAERFFETITESLADSDAPGEFSIVGGVNRMTVRGDGTFTDERIGWSFAVVTDFGILEMTVDATQSGEWSVEGDTIRTTITEAADPTYEMRIDGLPFEIPGGALPIDPPDSSLPTGSAVCNGDVLEVMVDGYTSYWMRTG